MNRFSKSPVLNIFSFATRRGVKIKAVVITTALICTLFSGFALAGQGVSQYCSDDAGNEVHVINSPATLNLEAGHPLFGAGPETSHLVCYSTTSSGSSDPEITGGAIALYTANPGTSSNSAATYCYSDPAAMVKVECAAGTSLNTQNPASPSSGTNAGGQASVLGTPVPVPSNSVGAGMGCASGTVAIGITGCAWGGIAGISGTTDSAGLIAASGGNGWAGGWYLATSAQGPATAALLAISGLGSANGNGNSVSGVPWSAAISGTGSSAATLLAVSGTGFAGAPIAVTGGNAWAGGWYLGASGQGPATAALLALSGTGTSNSYGDGLTPGIAISGANNATGRDVAVSGAGTANASQLSVSGGTGAVTVQGTNVTAELLLGVLEELEVIETPEIELPVDLPPEEDPFAQTNGPNSALTVPSSVIVEILKDPNSSNIDGLLTNTSSSSQTTRCRATVIEIRAKGSYGNKLWSYFQKVSRCYNGSRLSQVRRTRWAEVYSSGWEFVGHIENSEYGGSGQWDYYAFTQGSFKLCPGPWGCWQNKTPWIEQRVTASGSHSVNYFGG